MISPCFTSLLGRPGALSASHSRAWRSRTSQSLAAPILEVKWSCSRSDIRRVSGPRGIEWRFVAVLSSSVMLVADHLHWHVSWPSIITCTSYSQSDFGSSPRVCSSGKLRFVVGITNGALTQAVAQRQGDIVRGTDFTDLAEVPVEEVFLMVRQAPFGHDRAAARQYGQTLRRHRHAAQQHARMNGEVVDSVQPAPAACRGRLPR